MREALGEIFVYGHMVVQVSNLEFGRGLIMLHRHHTCKGSLTGAAMPQRELEARERLSLDREIRPID